MSGIARPLFVVIEGVDRVGKNTQADRLADRLRAAGMKTSKFTTPDYSTPTGVLISKFLSGRVKITTDFGDPGHGNDALALQSLLVANRYQVASRILEALARGETVVCVRWWQSALLYGAEDGLDPTWIREVYSLLPEPDLYLLLDVDPSKVVGRFDRGSHYESSFSMQQKLFRAYQELWRDDRNRDESERRRWVLVRGDADPDVVVDRVWTTMCLFFWGKPELGQLAGRRSNR